MTSKGTIFFDYDGTLHNSMAVYGPAFRRAYAWLVEGGYKQPQEFSDAWISQWLGFTTRDMWTTFAPDLDEAVWREASHIVGREMDERTATGKAQLFEGVPEMLAELKNAGYELAFLSNCRNAYCNVHRDMFGLDDFFSAYYTAEAYHDIPKWQIYAQAAPAHPYPHVMVGDRFHDIEVATQANIPSVGCLYGFGSEEELAAASCLVREPAEIPAAVKALLLHRETPE